MLARLKWCVLPRGPRDTSPTIGVTNPNLEIRQPNEYLWRHWYVSVVSIIFIVPCQYPTTSIYFLATFYTIFRTNLLIQCPVPVPVCCMFFVSQKPNIKRSPNGIKTDGELFWNIYDFWEVKSMRDGVRGGNEVGGRAPGCQARPWPSWPPCKVVGALLSPQDI